MEEVERHTEAHRGLWDQDVAQGVLVMSGRQTPPTGGVIIVNGKSRTPLDALIAADPFYKEGIADYDGYEFTPGKYQPALKKLLGRSLLLPLKIPKATPALPIH